MSIRFRSVPSWLSIVGLITASSSASAALNHSLEHANSPSAKEISISSKTHGGKTDKIFIDGLGREVSLRGFNVSGEVKLAENGFQPFANVADAKVSFNLLGQKTGSNMVRYTVAWEGIHPQPGVIDYAYLDKAISFMRQAINNDIYVLVDYHSDLFSRHTFKTDSKDTGNGAPKWAVPDVVGKDDCSLPCDLTWSAHKLSDSAVRNAMKSFWYDQWIMDTDITETVELYIPANNRCADIAASNMNNSTTVLAYSCNNMANQQWKYKKSGTLQSKKDESKCLDVAGARTGNNTDIQIYACNDSKAQKFIVDKKGRLHSALDFNKCIVDNSGNLALWDCSSTNLGQQFVLRNASNGDNVGKNLTYSQSAFVWQIGQVAAYMKAQMTEYEFAHVLGFEPLNEPYDGGIGAMSFKEFDNQLIWPFYERVRAELDAKGINDKPVYAEPMVFWSSIAGITAPATGGHHLDYQPGDGFVFTPHFYDQGRMGINDVSVARNGAHFPNLDQIRDEARFLNLATFLSEFGMWLDGYGQTDTERVVNGTYQGMESSDRTLTNHGGKNRFVDFYTPLISGAQWQWDYYYDNHHEYQNGNRDKLKTTEDAWNGENFSVIKHYGEGYNVQANLVERSYPRAVQGEVMHFAYEGLVPDENNSVMAYRSIRTTLSNDFIDKEFFRNTKFSFLAWKGRNSEAPTEVYVPRHMAPTELTIITERGVFKNLPVSSSITNVNNEVVVRKDPNKQAGAGHVVTVWDDVDSGEADNSYHFTLIIDTSSGSQAADMSAVTLEQLRLSLIETVNAQRSPVYLTTDMTHGGYPADKGATADEGNGWVSLVNQRSGKCLDVAGGRTFNGTNVQSYQCNGSNAQKWLYEPSSGFLRSGVNSNKCLDNGGQHRNDGKLVIWGCQNSNNMRWDFIGNAIVPRVNHGYAVDAYGTGNSSNVGIWAKHTGHNQQWVRQY